MQQTQKTVDFKFNHINQFTYAEMNNLFVFFFSFNKNVFKKKL